MATKYRCADCSNVSDVRIEECPSCHSDRIRAFDPSVKAAAPPPKPVAPPAKAVDKSKDITEIKVDAGADRLLFDMPEVERVLGGGIVKGSRILITGEPGIGKSTLLLKISAGVARRLKNRKGAVLYAVGEEPEKSVAARAKRMAQSVPGLRVLESQSMEDVEASVAANRPALLIMDSVSTFSPSADTQGIGKMKKIEMVLDRVTELCRRYGMAAIIVVHVTKEGEAGGPKSLEHMVDVYTIFSGERTQDLRYLTCPKNREGASGEVATLEMTSDGLMEVPNAADTILAHRSTDPGAVIFPTTDVGRATLMEIDASVQGEPGLDEEGNRTGSAPRLTSAVGLQAGRIPRMITLISETVTLLGSTIDIEVNRVGDAVIGDEAIDLAVAAAIASSRIKYVVPEHLVVMGVLSVNGRVKPVDRLRARLEAAVNGKFTQAIIPASQMDAPNLPKGIELIPMEHLRDLTPWLIRYAQPTRHVAKGQKAAQSYLIEAS